jgi:hypothetical protein
MNNEFKGTIYILIYRIEYEGDRLCGVYSTLDLANKASLIIGSRCPPGSMETLEIEERVLDSPPRFEWEQLP